MKYIRHKTKGFFLFPEAISESDMAYFFCANPRVDIISAGFVGPNLVCYGHSQLLNIGVKLDDSEMLRSQFE